MSCCITEYNKCQLVQETWNSDTLTFTDGDDLPIDLTQGYQAEYSIITMLGNRKTYTMADKLAIVGEDNNQIIINPIEDLQETLYNHEFVIINPNGVRMLVFQGILTITSKGCGCKN